MKLYIAMSLENPARELTPLQEDAAPVREVGEAARPRSMEHYSSKPIAERVLKRVGL